MKSFKRTQHIIGIFEPYFTLRRAVHILRSMIDPETAAEEIGISAIAYKKLCALFIGTVDDDTKTLRQAVESGNREEIRSRAHHIKGAAVNLEFTVLARQAGNIQNMALEADFNTIQMELEQLCNEYADIRMGIEVIL